MSERIHRRALLEAALSFLVTTPRWASVLGPALGSVACGGRDEGTPPSVSAVTDNIVSAYFPDDSADAIRALGVRYLELVAPNASDDGITEYLAPTAALIEGSESVSAALDALHAKVQDDFVQGTDLIVDGWVLATTELQLCALVARDSPVIATQ